MGNDCLASTPVDHYKTYFENVKTSQIKDFWTTIQVYKIKKLYDAVTSKHPDYEKHTHLELPQFLSLFPELQSYPQRQKLRVFQMFNFDGNGLVDWNNFYSTISICYFGSEEILAVMMFLIFDEGLVKQLTMPEVELMCDHNQAYIISKQQSGAQIPLFDPSDIVKNLLKGSEVLTIEKWMNEYKKYFNISKFRRIFNIFIEEKLEKELIKHFSEYNNLYVEDQDRYVSYVIDFKWFETWKLYVKQEYGYVLSSVNKKPVTFKTKKLMKTATNINGQKKVADPLTLRELKFEENKKIGKKVSNQDDDVPQQIKNFDFIHSNIGQKPKEINNKVLEGDFEQILRQDIIQNRDYVLISEKVWKMLKRIYEGYPQFRRTGFDYIQLYPKILRILPVKKGMIMYNEQNIKQVSAYYAVEDIFQAIITKQDLPSKKFFFKCFGMIKWEEIPDPSATLAELTTQVIIYIAIVNKSESEMFDKKYGKLPKDITQINVGDEVKFLHSRKGRQMNMIFLGKNIEGKCILHVPGDSYIQDICVLQQELIKKGKYHPLKSMDPVKLGKKEDCAMIGIPNNKGLGYINSVIMHLYYNQGLRQQLLLLNMPEQKDNPPKILQTLSKIFKDLTSKNKIKTKIISQAIVQVLPDFHQFSAEMCNQFTNQFYEVLSKQLKLQNLKDFPQSNKLIIEKKTLCQKCKKSSTQTEQRYSLVLPLHNNTFKYYQIIFVPFCQSLNGPEMKRYSFKLKVGATLNEYKNAFENVAGLKQENKKYLLMEVYAQNIVKNYSTAKGDATLDELLLRDTDTIVAYELKLDFTDFVGKHYSHYVDFDNNQVKIDQFIDCKNPTRGWIFGKVCEKDYTPYGHRTIIRVIHKFSKGQQWEISYDVDEESVANFPTRSYLNGQQYHIRLQQRYFNEASNDMEICNMPLVVVLTNWMRWRQFYYLVYLQMRKFINQQSINYSLEEDCEQQEEFQIYSSKSLGSKSKKKTQKKIKLNNFKQFLYGPQFPYKLSFVDYSGRCAVCFKFLKTQIFPGEQDSYCSGCQLSTSEPISWQIKIADVMVCVNWKKLDFLKKQVVKDHSSYANLAIEKKNDVETLQDCFNALSTGYSQRANQICCNIETDVTIHQNIKSMPQSLTIFLERIIQENDLIKIINKHVKFDQQLKIKNENYTLVGVTSLQGGSNKSTKYRVFVLVSNDQWLEYDGNAVRTVKKNYVEKLCALNLYYRKKEEMQQKT